jgi:hypothetical protein
MPCEVTGNEYAEFLVEKNGYSFLKVEKEPGFASSDAHLLRVLHAIEDGTLSILSKNKITEVNYLVLSPWTSVFGIIDHNKELFLALFSPEDAKIDCDEIGGIIPFRPSEPNDSIVIVFNNIPVNVGC